MPMAFVPHVPVPPLRQSGQTGTMSRNVPHVPLNSRTAVSAITHRPFISRRKNRRGRKRAASWSVGYTNRWSTTFLHCNYKHY